MVWQHDALAPNEPDDDPEQRPRDDVVDGRTTHRQRARGRPKHLKIDENARQHGHRRNRERNAEKERERERRRPVAGKRWIEPRRQRTAQGERQDEAGAGDTDDASRVTPQQADVELETCEKHEHENRAGRDGPNQAHGVSGEYSSGTDPEPPVRIRTVPARCPRPAHRRPAAAPPDARAGRPPRPGR